MRVALLLAALPLMAGLAGCTQGTPGDDFQATCPSWIKGRDAMGVNGNLLFTNQTTMPDFDRWDFREGNNSAWTGRNNPHGRPGTGLGDGLEELFDRPLDFLVFDFRFTEDGKRMLYIQDAQLIVRFYASEGGNPGEPLDAYLQGRPQTAKSEWVYTTAPGGFLLVNDTLRVDLARPDEAPNPRGVFVHWQMVPNLDRNVDTASVAIMRYSPEFWYRSCNADGTTP
jgi:hypothetical protein